MYGIVRLFSEQVKETEKEALTCLRRIMHRAAQAKPVSTSLMDNLIEPGLEDDDLLNMWKQNRRLLQIIDCAAGSAPTLALNRSDASIADLSMEGPSTIWRDNNYRDQFVLGSDLLQEEALESENSFFSLPHVGVPFSWPAASSVIQDDPNDSVEAGVELMRGDKEARESLLAIPDFYRPLEDSSHFLDRLVEDQSGVYVDPDGPLRSTFNESIGEDIQARLEDLLAPALDGAAGTDEPLLHSLYNIHADPGAFPDYDYGNDAKYDDFYAESQNVAVHGSASNSDEISGVNNLNTRRRRYVVDMEPHFTHDEVKRAMELISKTSPRADHLILSTPSLLEERVNATLLQSRTFLDVDTVLGLPKGESFVVSGALAYVRLACMSQLTLGTSTGSRGGSMNEMSVAAYGMEKSTLSELGPFVPPNESVMDMIPANPEDELYALVEVSGHGSQVNANESMFHGLQSDSLGLGHVSSDDINGDKGNLYDNPPAWGDGRPEYANGVSNSHSDPELVMTFGNHGTYNLGDDSVQYTGYGAAQTMQSASQLLVEPQTPGRSQLDSFTEFDVHGARKSRSWSEDDAGSDRLQNVHRTLLTFLQAKTARPLTSDASKSNSSTSSDARRLLASSVASGGQVTVNDLLQGRKRLTSAKVFLYLLELANASMVTLIQDEPFDEIGISVV